MLVMSFQNLYIPSILLLLFPKKNPEIGPTLIIPWSSDIKSYPNTIAATVKLPFMPNIRHPFEPISTNE